MKEQSEMFTIHIYDSPSNRREKQPSCETGHFITILMQDNNKKNTLNNKT